MFNSGSCSALAVLAPNYFYCTSPHFGSICPCKVPPFFQLPKWSQPKLMTKWYTFAIFINLLFFPSSVILLASDSEAFCYQVMTQLEHHDGPFIFNLDMHFASISIKDQQLGCSLLISVPVRGYSNIRRFPIPAVIPVFFRIPVSNYCPKLLFNWQ